MGASRAAAAGGLAPTQRTRDRSPLGNPSGPAPPHIPPCATSRCKLRAIERRAASRALRCLTLLPMRHPTRWWRVATSQLRKENKCVMLGIDEMERLKGIPLKLLAYEQLMHTRPELRQRAALVQVGPTYNPSFPLAPPRSPSPPIRPSPPPPIRPRAPSVLPPVGSFARSASALLSATPPLTARRHPYPGRNQGAKFHARRRGGLRGGACGGVGGDGAYRCGVSRHRDLH